MEELEAEQVYLLMRKEYRISRNVRAQWYFSHLGQLIQVPKRHMVDEYKDELEVVSVIPASPPPDWDSDTSHLYRYRVTARTGVTFLARVYRLVFCLDLSPSVATVDTSSGVVLLDAVFPTLGRCLEGITRPFYVPGSELLYKPQLYVTVIAHTPFFTTQTHQVLVQGWLLTEDNLQSFLGTVGGKLNDIEDMFADVTAMANDQLEAQRMESERLVGQLFEDEPGDSSAASAAVPMVSPDIGFVNMLRYGILALQLLPENSSAGLIVVTDGAIGLPDATMFDSLLVQLRNNTVACSFLLLDSGCQPSAGLGSLPYTDLMHFLATATCGALLARLPAVLHDFDYVMNVYHRAFLCWGFQKSLGGSGPMQHAAGQPDEPWCSTPRLEGCVPDTPLDLITKHQSDGVLNSSLESVLSCRLREGYNIRAVQMEDGAIQITLVLPWKYSIFIEYMLKSAWPPTGGDVQFELNITGKQRYTPSYDFLHDVTCARTRTKSPYRQAMFSKFWSSLKSMRHSDQLLEHLHSFNSSATLYTVPDVVRSGGPLFFLSENTGAPEPFSGEPAYQTFCNFWKPVCMLDINIWQKWMHAHRIGLLLEHDHPLPKHLCLPNNSGRFNPVQCRQATKAVTSMLAEVTDFALLDGHSYIKFLYSAEKEGAPPTSFYMLRVNLAVRPPCMVVRLAFLGGTPGDLRNQIVKELRERILALTFTEGQTALSADPPIRKNARPIEKSAVPKTVAIDDGTPERGLLPADHYSASRSATHEVSCCVLLKKPVEKFLIRYDRVPRNFLSPV
ncbi:KICSTOR complex protein SZT2-like [Pollicipes pollicipes]|uniref:KICSTOR complex protein SZT2-like n=1 Tax=Pollicipes pollicipes TaxID=41117 RepID=UPI00188495F0|nr:KICSTOR complex protein SZT2-like [Pollicipes pollicipes]